VSQYQKGKINVDLPEQEIVSGSGISWAICTSPQTDNHASIPPLSFYRLDAIPATEPTASKQNDLVQNSYFILKCGNAHLPTCQG